MGTHSLTLLTRATMKIALFALGFLAFAQGLEELSGNMRVEFDYSEDNDDQTGGCITCPDGRQRNLCHGFAEIRSEFNGIETLHGRIEKREEDDAPRKASKMGYRVPGRRAANKIIEVQGNCCWKFYERSRYAGDMRSVRGSRTLNPLYFAPRSLKVVECE